MKKLFTLLLLALLLVNTESKATGYFAFNINRILFVGGDSCITRINTAIALGNKQYLFVGSSDCNNKGDIPSTTSQQKGSNIIVGVVDSAYSLLWVKVYGGDDSVVEEGVSVCITSDGGFAILAPTISTTGDITASYEREDIWLLKLDKNGNKVFEKTFGSPYSDMPFSIANSEHNGLLILGTSNGSGNDIPSHYGDSTTKDWVLIKTDSLGKKDWVKTIGGTRDESTEGEILVVDTSYYLISNSNSKDFDCADTSWYAGDTAGYNFHLLKLDTAGKVLWDKSYGGFEDDKANTAIYTHAQSQKRIHMAGYTKSSSVMVSGNKKGAKTGWIMTADLDGNSVGSELLTDSPYVYGNKTFLFSGSPSLVAVQQVIDTSANSRKEELHFHHFLGAKYGFNQKRHIGCSVYDNVAAIIPLENNHNRHYYALFGTAGEASSFQPQGGVGQKGAGQKGFVAHLDWGLYGSVNDVTKATPLVVAPNPADNVVTITLSKEYNGGQIHLLNMQGVVVYENELNSNQLSINTSRLPRGIYMLQYEDGDGTRYNTRLVLQ